MIRISCTRWMTFRRKLKIRKPNKLFLVYFFSFFVVILIPVFLMSLSSYRLVVSTVQDELSQANRNAIQQTGMSLDRFLTEVATLSVQLGLDGRVYAVARHPEDSYLLNDVQDRIKSLSAENVYVHSIQLYFKNNDRIYSSDGASFAYKDEPFNEWIRELERSEENHVWLPTSAYVNHDGNEFRIVTLARAIPVAFPEKVGYVAIHVYADHIQAIVDAADPQGRSVVRLFDADGRFITPLDADEAERSAIAERARVAIDRGAEGTVLDEAATPNLLVAFGAPLQNGWTLMSETSLAYLYEKLSYVRRVIALTGAVLLALGVAVSYYFSTTMVHPIKQLVEKSKRYQKELALPNDEAEGNALRYVSGLFDNVVGKHRALEASYKANYQAMVDRFLYHILFQKAGNAFDVDEKIAYLQLPIANRHFAVMVVEIDDYSLWSDRYSADDVGLFRFALNNISQELVSARYPNISTELNDHQIALLVNLPSIDEAHIASLRETAASLIDTTTRLLRFSVTVGIGDPAEDILQAHRSYEQAVDAVKLKVLLGPGAVVTQDDVRQRPHNEFYYPVQLERSLLNNLRTGNEANVKMYLRQLREDITSKGSVERSMIYRVYHRLLDAAIALLVENRMTAEEIFAPDAPPHEQLEKKETLDAIHEWMEQALCTIAGALPSGAKANGNVEAAIRFIEAHFTEDLSVERISDAVQLNAAYLSRIFKQDTGKTILEYLTIRRIQESKKLLLSTKRNIHEIAQAVGYNNTNSYIRFFRKYEGVTPGEFRKANRSAG